MEFPMKKILVVDNDKFILGFMNDILSERGHQVVTAEGGLSAVDILKTYTPDIIFVDLVMPKIEGKQLCKIIRGMPGLRDVGIVILSAIAVEENIKIKEFRADACIAKGPINEMAKHIVEIVEKYGLASLNGLPGEAIGAPGMFSRIITKELLSIKNHFQTILGKISEGVLEVTSGGRIVYANAIALSIIEIPEEKLLGSHFIDLFTDDNRHRVAELMKPSRNKPQISTEEFPLPLNRHKIALQFLPIDEYAATSLIIINDLTERLKEEADKKKLEAQLHRAQKIEAMGLMAGSVAHDLNNILSGIVSYPELLLMNLSEDSPLRKPIKTIQESGMRAADVVEDLMTVARGVSRNKEILNLSTIVGKHLKSIEHQALEKTYSFVNFKMDLDPDLLNIMGSPTQINKTVMNLLANASEAIDETGTVTISTINQYLDESLKGYEDVRIGEYAVLMVSDDGSGIPPEDLERIFEPFYTKKVMGRAGTGLGLTVVWNTLQNHNGYINIKSSEKGTTFELYFPVTREEVVVEGEKVPLEDYLGCGEKILIVDDEERQREIAGGMLNELGYNAESVTSGEDAIEYVKKHPADLIVLDMVMPKGINGRETYGEIIKIRPGQKAIIASGWAKTKEIDAAQALGAGKYIKKPYTLEKIGVAVKKELEK
ncbi:MAG: response regulator [Deltaproteobacteria bacterium]|nr:response regulator [Deltaproteobacteria bacterium]